ncbi:ATPase, F1 complex, OSCP/delta subunit protein [Wolffia australiana]
MEPLSSQEPAVTRMTFSPTSSADPFQVYLRPFSGTQSDKLLQKLEALAYLPGRRTPNTTQSLFFHREAATGYAEALLDIAYCSGATTAMQMDVRRFRRGIQALIGDEQSGVETKALAMQRLAEEGGFCRQLVTLVKMLVRKGKVGLVDKVMEEFDRINDELNGIRTPPFSLSETISSE